MGRKSTIDLLPPTIKKKLGKMIKEGTLTLDQIVSELETSMGDQAPSRTAIWRYKDKFKQVMKGVLERREIAKVWGETLGVATDSDQGRMLVEMMQSLLTDTVVSASDGEPLTPKAAKELALAIKAAAEAGGLSLKQQDLIEKRAREKLLEEQNKKLEGLQKSGTLSPETHATIRREVFGLA